MRREVCINLWKQRTPLVYRKRRIEEPIHELILAQHPLRDIGDIAPETLKFASLEVCVSSFVYDLCQPSRGVIDGELKGFDPPTSGNQCIYNSASPILDSFAYAASSALIVRVDHVI